MREEEILEVLSQPDLESEPLFFPKDRTVGNPRKLRAVLEGLKEIPGFREDAERLAEDVAIRLGTGESEAVVNQHEWNDLRGRWSTLYARLLGLKKFLGAKIPSKRTEYIYIKLPDSDDIGENAQAMSVFDKFLKQVVFHPKIEGQVKLTGCERGSIWLQVYLGVPAAVALVGGIAWSAALVWHKVEEARVVGQMVESLKIKNESLKEVQLAQKAAMELLIEAEASRLANEHYGETDPEATMRLRQTIQEFSVMIERGAKIHPALGAPADVKNLFPNFKNLSLLGSQTKLLRNENGGEPGATTASS